jgi:hypothetical protein
MASNSLQTDRPSSSCFIMPNFGSICDLIVLPHPPPPAPPPPPNKSYSPAWCALSQHTEVDQPPPPPNKI